MHFILSANEGVLGMSRRENRAAQGAPQWTPTDSSTTKWKNSSPRRNEARLTLFQREFRARGQLDETDCGQHRGVKIEIEVDKKWDAESGYGLPPRNLRE